MISRAFGLFLILASIALGLYAAAETHVVIMHTNDIRGHLLAGSNSAGSARLAAVVRQTRPDLMLDAGDMLAGDLISDAFQGQSAVDVMNAIGYDAAAIGTNDFSFGLEALRARAGQA